ncbi:hypothetical protein EMIHUDRAFT_112218 [Emiliania huxleyi CCMP1516]|uniref:GYF domain-containing protein n=2 Tax=Emiliania huxleyi TaxID=2903 RepID=A0A0D3KA40_EMIH1|nr:hypothetical protein EMIHUDRAFT_112218 [Emiliania huxleyi CCMP1516]EOD32625.1 hypothetical protein EMIHUDRAFT_112218 [Emiliania huxleyi CCMP1516]|eukprot:XP_005785054.1 hypothetical protein EMIHUDRAFT_112218 [Emiliania huxleyi CCMP1516]
MVENGVYENGATDAEAYVTLMSQEVKSLNFAAEENYTVRLCKELVAYHYPDELPLGSFELLASNKIRSDEETAEDPDFDWKPRKEQVFSDKMLMQLSIWKKEWDEETKSYEPVDLSYMPYGKELTKQWKKLGYLDGAFWPRPRPPRRRTAAPSPRPSFPGGALSRRAAPPHLIRKKDAWEAAGEIENKDDALAWLQRHKEKDYNAALKLQGRRAEGEEVEVEEEEPEPDDPDVEVYVCEPPPLRGM